MSPKEKMYDERVSPLMAQILEICKEHKIAMVASFSLDTDESGDFNCTSALTTDEYSPPACFHLAVEILYG